MLPPPYACPRALLARHNRVASSRTLGLSPMPTANCAPAIRDTVRDAALAHAMTWQRPLRSFLHFARQLTCEGLPPSLQVKCRQLPCWARLYFVLELSPCFTAEPVCTFQCSPQLLLRTCCLGIFPHDQRHFSTVCAGHRLTDVQLERTASPSSEDRYTHFADTCKCQALRARDAHRMPRHVAFRARPSTDLADLLRDFSRWSPLQVHDGESAKSLPCRGP